MPLTIFPKSSVIVVWEDSKYVSVSDICWYQERLSKLTPVQWQKYRPWITVQGRGSSGFTVENEQIFNKGNAKGIKSQIIYTLEFVC